MSKKPSKLYSAFVIGSTGAIGKSLVKELLSSPACGKVTAVTRKTVTESDFGESKSDKFVNKVIDFDHPDPKDFSGYDAGFSTMGTTLKKSPVPEDYRKIDYTYPTAIAEVARKQGTKYFTAVTSIGANLDSYFTLVRQKGEIEEKLKGLGFDKCVIWRPGMLLTDRGDSRPGEWIEQVFQWGYGYLNWAFVGPLVRYQALRVESVARAMRLEFEEYWENSNNEEKSTRIYEAEEIADIAFKKQED